MEKSSNVHQISSSFKNIVRTLRLIGAYPIILREESNVLQSNASVPSRKTPIENSNSITYEKGSWKDKITWGSYFITAIQFICSINYALKVALKIPIPLDLVRFREELEKEKNVFYSSGSNLTFLARTALQLLSHLYSLINVGLLVEWLNGWKDFEQEFISCFDSSLYFRLSPGVLSKLVLAAFLILVNLLWVIPGFLMVAFTYEINPDLFLVGFIVVAVALIFFNITPQFEDVKVFLMLKTLHVTMAQVRQSIEKTSTRSEIYADDVTAWRNLVEKIRDQVELCGNYIKGRLLANIMETIFLTSVGIFYIADTVSRGILNQSTYVFCIMTIIFCAFTIARVYIPVRQAENIYAEEKLLVKDIMKIHDRSSDEMVKTELKFFHNAMKMEPTLVKIGNYFDLDKKLLVVIGIQTLTFIIAVAQFGISGE